MRNRLRNVCFNCGADIGLWDRFCERDDTCGERECNREAQAMARQEREEAHERLDRELDR